MKSLIDTIKGSKEFLVCLPLKADVVELRLNRQ